MAVLLAQGENRVFVSYHQFWIVDLGCAPGPGFGPSNGLVTVTGPGAAVVHTGIHTGPVVVEVRVFDAAPPTPDRAGWDEIVQVSIHAPHGRLDVTAMTVHNRHSLPKLCPGGPGDYRLRVHARGRDVLPDGVPDKNPTEHYLIQVWPGPAAPEIVHKSSDRYGASVRATTPRQARPAGPDVTEDPLKLRIEEKLRRARDGAAEPDIV